MPGSVATIDQQAFVGNAITSLTLEDGVTTIRNGAFAGNKLTNITLPNSISHIDDFAFGSNLLTTVTIPSNLAVIGNGAFALNMLKSVHIAGDSNNHATFTDDSGTTLRLGHVFRTNPTGANIRDETVREYIPTYTTATDPTNPYHYISEAAKLDLHGDGTLTTVGGVLINPAQVRVRYIDMCGKELKQALYTVSPRYPDYFATSNPSGDFSSGSYYFGGDTYTAIAPTIPGYITPQNQTKTLTAGDNVITLMYATAIYSVDFAGKAAPSGVTDKLVALSQLSIDPSGDCATIALAQLLTGAGVSAPVNVSIVGGL